MWTGPSHKAAVIWLQACASTCIANKHIAEHLSTAGGTAAAADLTHLHELVIVVVLFGMVQHRCGAPQLQCSPVISPAAARDIQ